MGLDEAATGEVGTAFAAERKFQLKTAFGGTAEQHHPTGCEQAQEAGRAAGDVRSAFRQSVWRRGAGKSASARVRAHPEPIAGDNGAEHPVVIAARRALEVSRSTIAQLSEPVEGSVDGVLEAAAAPQGGNGATRLEVARR
jgi:hypothetical protein